LFSGVVLGGTVATPGGPPPYTLVDSEPVQLEVRPLPSTGKLPGFTGAVGAFAQPTAQLSTNRVVVGEPVKLTVKVRGEANMARLAPPPPPRTRDWQVLPATADKTTPPQVVQALGVAAFTYTLVPLSEKSHATPPIPFSFFDPERGGYADLTIPPVPVEVLPGTAPVDLASFERADSLRPEEEQELTLSELATAPGMRAGSLVPLQQQGWFPLLQCAPAAAFFGLWTWDRRRRFFEQHPDVLLCRRARRALRRERRKLQRAARARDAVRFAGTAANAMRVASAPHYPAEPRALVGSDILALLPETQRSGRSGEVVRKLFVVNDATRFALSPTDCHEILGLAPEIEQVLQNLEARL
jgi:hypothetical protein